MAISLEEHWMLQAKLNIFPKPFNEKEDNNLHNAEEIKNVTRSLQSDQILMLIMGDDKEKYYVIPDEVADVIREKWNIQLSKKAYLSLLENRKFFNKERLKRIANEANIHVKYATNENLIEQIMKHVNPSDALTTFVPKEDLNKELEKLCVSITNKKGSSKRDRIDRIFRTLDELSHKKPSYEDPRKIYFQYFEQLAHRNHKELRDLKIIEKDLDIEKAFEEGTRYIFESIFNHELGVMQGTDHPDGKIRINENSILLWDNKSKETKCKLKSHLDQFHRYLRDSSDNVMTFLVIAPEFDANSEQIAHIQKAKENITFSLVNAVDLKFIAEEWQKSKVKKKKFPLSVFNIAGKVDHNMLKNAFELV